MAITSLLFDSFHDAPAAWGEICHKDDLAMDLRALDAFQRTLADQCRCWGLVVFDETGKAIGCAALCRFDTEMIETKNAAVMHWRDRVRHIWPGFAKMRVLFCGLPVPSGSSHLRVREGASAELVIAEVERVMRRLAQSEGAKLLVFKELSENDAAMTAVLTKMDFIRGPIPPMHLIDAPFKSFAEYAGALKSRYRAQVHRSQKKLEAAGFEITSGRGVAFFNAHFNDEVHRLYVEVQKRAEQKLELMPPDFFRETAAALGDEVLLTVIRRGGRVCAFTFAITRSKTHYNMYSGLDYALNNEGDLYFNLFYADIDQALKSGAPSLHLGQTSDAFKSRLGSSTEKLFFYAHARSKLFHKILRLFKDLAFPKVAEVEPHDVFTKPQKKA